MLSKIKIKKINFLHTKKGREKEQKFIAEGSKIVHELVKEGFVTEIFATSNFFHDFKKTYPTIKTEINLIDEIEIKKISSLVNPSGVLAICDFKVQQENSLTSIDKVSIFLDDIRDPGNLGTIIRLADWFGIKNIFCSLSSVDCYNSKVIQASMGSIGRVSVKYIDFEDFIRLYEGGEGIKIDLWAAVLNGESIYDCKLPNNLVLVIGNESVGVSQEVINKASKSISIPRSLTSETESLNAASASAIILSEVFRKLNFL